MRIRGEKAGTKKGAALILTLAVTSLLIVLAVSIMTAAFTNQIGTFGMDRSSQLKLLAQTGMEKSISILREKIVQRVITDGHSNSILYTIAQSPKTETMHLLDLDPQTDLPDTSTGDKYSIYFNIYKNDSFSLDSSSQTASTKNEGDCYATFSDGDPSDSGENTYEDSSDGIKKNCIKIRLIAYGRGESKRTETVYIDKNSISDYYLDKLFQNTLSALGEPGTAGEEPIKSLTSFPEIQRPGKLQISGDIYLQGERLALESDQNIEVNGNLKVLASQDANEVNFNKNLLFYDYDEDSRIETNTNLSFPADLKRAFSIKGGFDETPKTPIVENSRLRNVAPLGISGTGKTVDTILSAPDTGFPLVKGNTDDYAMVAAKCVQNGSQPVDFSRLVLGRDLDSHTGLRRFLATRPDLNLEGGSYRNESDYIKLFKVILVDGDLLIDASKLYYDQITDNNYDQITDESPGIDISDFRKMRMMNYIIIASGTVTLKGTVEMYSSSIMAKDIIFESGTLDMPVTDADDDYVKNVLDQLNNLQLDRILVGETEHTAEIDPETGMVYPADPLKDVIDPAMNFTNSTLASDGENLADAYAAARRMKVQTTISLSGIGSDDSVKEISADMGEYGETWADARGYVTNTQKALINEYLIKNLSSDYAKQLKFKIISWEER